MNPVYDEAMQLADKLHDARLEIVRIAGELTQAQYELTISAAKIERALIKRVGDEKKLAPTADARERIFILARDADEEYRAQHDRCNRLQLELDKTKAEAATLQDKLRIMTAAMREG